MNKSPFISVLSALVLCGAALDADPAAAQFSGAARGEGTSRPDRVGPAVLGGSAAPRSAADIVGGKVAITTYHYDNLRTGWNNHETALTARSFPASFGIIATVTLDDQVDAQPLLVPNVTIGAGPYAGTTHDVVYVATESNTVYAIDASSGAKLLQRSLGAPVPAPLMTAPIP